MRFSSALFLHLPSLLVLACILPVARAQDAAKPPKTKSPKAEAPASASAEARAAEAKAAKARAAERRTLPPALRYIDEEREARSKKWASLSTAGLGGKISYSLSYEPDTKGKTARFWIEVRGTVTRPGDLVFSMPAWRPGSYRLANYGKAVVDLEAEIDGKETVIERLDPNLWKLAGLEKGALHLRYAIVARRSKLRSRDKEAGLCFRIRGPSLWMSEVRHKEMPVQVELVLPKDWQVTTGLERMGPARSRKSLRRHRYRAPDYDVLIDCPLMMGNYEFFDFRLDGKRFEIAIYGAGKDKTDRQEFAGRIKMICRNFGRMFGGFPFKHYSFLFLTGGFGGGGLEHLNSTNISMGSLRGSKPGKKSWTDSVISHEFFHLWNVKRLRPAALGPFDYTGPNRTTALWFAEGFTSYYGEKCLTQVGLQSPEDYWRHMSRAYTNLRRNPSRKRMDIAETSWTVWDGPYMGRPGTVSYYLKGECLGLLLDVLIRDATRNKRSLDDVMRKLYAQCMKENAGFEEDDIRNTCTEIAGQSMDQFFDSYIYGNEDLPVKAVLAKAGLLVKVTGEKQRSKIQLSQDPAAKGLALEIRKALLSPPAKARR